MIGIRNWNTRASTRMVLRMVPGFITTRMGIPTAGLGISLSSTARAATNLPTAINTTAIGLWAKKKALAFTSVSMETGTRASGKTT
jgi:hypothetical protein